MAGTFGELNKFISNLLFLIAMLFISRACVYNIIKQLFYALLSYIADSRHWLIYDSIEFVE